MLALIIAASPLLSQTSRISHSFVGTHNTAPQLGREFWIPVMMIGDDQSGKAIVLTVSSPKQTIVHVNFPGYVTISRQLKPYKMDTISFPIPWEIKTSAIIELKGVHVWSSDADLTCALVSHIPNSSEGFSVIPTIGWGREYVVAAYRAISDSLKHDAPSEFAVVANQNNTVVTITPSCDIRRETIPHYGDSTIAHASGVAFSDTIQRGQTVQYKSTLAKDCVASDVTGTVITATHSVGVTAGCQNAVDNCTWAITDYVAEMLPPTRTWGKTYYTSSQWMRTALVIGTKANQVIRRYDSVTHTLTTVCTLANRFGKFVVPSITRATRWESDTSFLLTQYLLNGINPAEVVIEPVELFKNRVTFNVDSTAGNAIYYNIANVIVNVAAAASTTLDGLPLKGLTRAGVDGKYYIYSGTVSAGSHVLASDSGVSINIVGYNANELTAWAGSLGTATFNSLDQTPPIAVPQDQCYTTRMMISDTGSGQSGLLYIALDTMFNIDYRLDSTWIEGTERAATYYDMHVRDSTKPAQLRVSIYDYAGNKTAIFSEYIPQAARITPPIQDFGAVNVKAKGPVYLYDSIINQGDVSFPITSFHFGTGDSTVFTIDSISLTPLAPQERRAIKIGFWPKVPLATWATLIFGDECIQQEVLLRGAGATADFYVTNADFGSVPVLTRRADSVYVVNSSTVLPVTVVDVALDSSVFTLLPNTFPMTVAPQGRKKIYLAFTPSDCVPVTSRIIVTSLEGDVRSATLNGIGDCASVSAEEVSALQPQVSINAGGSLHVALPAHFHLPAALVLSNILGTSVLCTSISAAEQDVDSRSLTSGVYFYRLSNGKESYTGKIVITSR